MKSVAFHYCQNIHRAFGLLLIETMSTRTFKYRPIWSHWTAKRIWNINFFPILKTQQLLTAASYSPPATKGAPWLGYPVTIRALI